VWFWWELWRGPRTWQEQWRTQATL
jgi:hypothetical protein